MSLTPVPRRDDDRDQVVVPVARAPYPDGPRETGTSTATRRTLERHWVVISILAHLLIIGALVLGLLEAPQPTPVPVLKITLVPLGPGSAGAGGGGGAGPAAAASSTAAEPAQPEIPAPAPETVTTPTTPQPELPTPPPPQPEIPKPTPPGPEIPPPAPEPIKQPPQTPPTPQPPHPMATAVPPPVALKIPPPKPRHIPPRRAQPRTNEIPRPAPVAQTALMPAPAPSAPAPTAAQSTPAAPGAAAGIPGPGKGTQGLGKGAFGNSAGPGDDYLDRLYKHLLRYKKYPADALSAKQQGAVEIGFTIARDGTISDVHIEKGSRFPSLDDATLTMVRSASPAPRLPENFKGDTARVKFHIDYKLNLLDQMF